MDVIYLDFIKALGSFSLNSSGMIYGCLSLRQVHPFLVKKLAGCPGPESGDEWCHSYISRKGGSLWLGIAVSPVL